MYNYKLCTWSKGDLPPWESVSAGPALNWGPRRILQKNYFWPETWGKNKGTQMKEVEHSRTFQSGEAGVQRGLWWEGAEPVWGGGRNVYRLWIRAEAEERHCEEDFQGKWGWIRWHSCLHSESKCRRGVQENSEGLASLCLQCDTGALGGLDSVGSERGKSKLNLYKTCGKSPRATLQKILVTFFFSV